MRIVVHGQQAFGKAVLEALLKRGENVIAVYVAPEKEGAKADPLKEAALAAKLPVYQPRPTRSRKCWRRIQGAQARPAGHGLRDTVRAGGIPQHSDARLDPVSPVAAAGLSRRQSAINWPIIKGEKETGLSIFWPDNGLDTGDVLIQKKTPISATDTLGTVYFDRLFPMGVEAMLEARRSGESRQGAAHQAGRVQGTYEGRCGPGNAKIDWGKPWEQIDRLIRGCNPAPGAWTTLDGKTLKIFDAKPLPAKDPKGIAGKLGEVVAVDADGFTVVCADGRFKITRVQPDGGKKIDAAEFISTAKLAAGARLRMSSSFQITENLPCPPRNIKARSPTSKFRRPPRSGRSSTSPRKSSASPPKISSLTATTRPRCRWTTSSRCKASRTAS